MEALPRYQKVLLATDGSPQAEPATRHALALAQQLQGTLMTIYVIDRHLAFSLGIHRDDALHELRTEGRQALAKVTSRAAELGIPVEPHLVEGRPGEVIVTDAERLQADLIVIGSQGQGALADMLLGSVSQYVLRHARVPVCVVRGVEG